MQQSPSTSITWRNTRGNKRCVDNEINGSEDRKRMKMDDETEESNFNELILMVLECVTKLKQITDKEITSSIDYFKNEFKRGSFTNLNFKNWENICGYFFRYGLHGAGLTRIKVLEAIENCPALHSILKKRQLKVINLGGGPGNNAIGLFSALQDYYNIRSSRKVGGNQINVTVVDAADKWSLCVKLVNSFLSEGQFGKISKLSANNNVDVSFLNVDLPGNRKENNKYFQTLIKADIILITKLISSVDEKVKQDIIKSLQAEIKSEALILFIDSPFNANLWNNFDLLYLSEKDNYYKPIVNKYKFNCYNDVESKARIAVLRKKKSTLS